MISYAAPAPPPKKIKPYNEFTPLARALDEVGDKWTLLIIRTLLPKELRFVDLRRALPGISNELLRSRLNRLVADGYLSRQRYRETPPRVEYDLTDKARGLLEVIHALSEFGRKYLWGPRRDGETFDLIALVKERMLALRELREFTGARQVLTLGVTGLAPQCIEIVSADEVEVRCLSADDVATAQFVGTTGGWSKALATGELDTLQFREPDEPLANMLLHCLVGTP